MSDEFESRTAGTRTRPNDTWLWVLGFLGIIVVCTTAIALGLWIGSMLG